MNILVVGAGYVGLISALGFAKLGNKVNVVDLNKDIINDLSNGRPTFYEPDLEELLNNKELKIWLDDALEKFDLIYSNERPGFLEGYKKLKDIIKPW